MSHLRRRRRPEASKAADSSQIESLLSTVFVLALAVLVGEKLNDYAREAGLLLPGFLSAMIAGVVITNVADVFKHPLDFAPIERGGAVALQLFLVMALMSTPLISVAVIIVPLMLNVVIQVVATVAIAYFVLFRLLGKRLRRGGDVGRVSGLWSLVDAGRHGDHG